MSKGVRMKMNEFVRNNDGLEFTVFEDLFLSEKSAEMQKSGVISFFAKYGFDKTDIKYAINKISGQDNCVNIRSLNVKPKRKDSRHKRNESVYKINGFAAKRKRLKVYVRLKDAGLFFNNLMNGGKDV